MKNKAAQHIAELEATIRRQAVTLSEYQERYRLAKSCLRDALLFMRHKSLCEAPCTCGERQLRESISRFFGETQSDLER